MANRNAALPEIQRIVFRIGVNLGDIARVRGLEAPPLARVPPVQRLPLVAARPPAPALPAAARVEAHPRGPVRLAQAPQRQPAVMTMQKHWLRSVRVGATLRQACRSPSFTDLLHRQCRLYVATVSIDGKAEKAWATACRDGNGQWALAR
jgi:hypothetical protein